MSTATTTMAEPRQRFGDRLTGSALVNAGFVGVLWVLEAIDSVTRHTLDTLGIASWRLDDAWSLLTHPLAHAGWGHLLANSLPLLVLGTLVGLEGLRRWFVTLLVVTLTSGVAAWLLTPPGANTLGASGVVFGWLTYLLVRGIYNRSWTQLALAVVLFTGYGGVLWGVLPSDPGISWQGHLGGALGGVVAASWLRRRPVRGR